MNNNLLTSEQCIEFLELQIDNEKTNDPGCELDVIIVNNDTNNHEANLYINSLNGQKIFNGTIRVFHRQNIGGSFGAFSYAYDQIFDEYDYFLFNEDDIMITHPNYMSRAIEIVNNDASIGFVSFSPISYHEPWHCGGGFGVSSKRILNLVKSTYGKLPFIESNRYEDFERSEIEFTNCIYRLGFQLVTVPEYSSLAKNYEKHTSQNRLEYVTEDNLNKTFIYNVGF
jgi:hypothetical protein